MKKMYYSWAIGLNLIAFCPSASVAQNYFSDATGSLLMLKFSPTVSWDSIRLLKNRYQAIQIDSTSRATTDVKLWKIPASVVAQNQGLATLMDAIDGSYNTKKHVKLSTDSVLLLQNLALGTSTTASPCWAGQLSASCTGNRNDKPLRISYLDSGMDINPSTGNPKNAFLARYFNKTLSKDFSGSGIADTYSHGTAMAYVMAKVLNAGGLPGTGTELLALKIFDNNNNCSPWNIVKALDYSLQQKVHVVSMSINWKARKPSATRFATKSVIELVIDVLGTQSISVVGAAGNSATNVDNASNPDLYHTPNFESTNLFVVGATDCNGKLLSTSNFGKKSVDIGALGLNIPTIGLNDVPQIQSGTSLSAAYVAGLIGVKSAHRVLATAPVDVVSMRSAIYRAYAVSADPSLRNQTVRGEVLRLTCVRALGKELPVEPETIDYQVFPNPVLQTAAVRFVAETDGMATLSIADLFGRVLETHVSPAVAGENTLTWDSKSVTAGFYLMTLKIGHRVQTQKIIVSK
jgi:Subtilase family/Secretion system C-terminal sorting domain